MIPNSEQLLAHYEKLRKTLSEASSHWPAMELGGVEISSTTVTKSEDLANTLNGALQAPTAGPTTNWFGWSQTTAAVNAGRWQGTTEAVKSPAYRLLDGEWVCGSVSVQVRHTGGQWRVTRLTEQVTPVDDHCESGLRFDVKTLARESYARSLTHRVYVRWDAQRAQMVPHAARLCEIEQPDGPDCCQA